MSDGPITYDFARPQAEMASIPTEQAQAGLIQAQTAAQQQQTNYNLWRQAYLMHAQNTPPGSDSTGMIEPTMAPSTPASAPGSSAAPVSAGASATPNPLQSNVSYVAGNAGATAAPSSPNSSVPTGRLHPAGGTAPVNAPPSAAVPEGQDDGTGGHFNEADTYNRAHQKYGLQTYDPQLLQQANMMELGGMPNAVATYKSEVDAGNQAKQLQAKSETQILNSIATAPDIWAAYSQVYGADKVKKAQELGVTPDQMRAHLWKVGHMITLSAQLPAEPQDNGKTITYVDPTTKAPMFGLGTVTKQLTPEATQTAATAQRGQDVTAATAARGQNFGAIEVGKDAAGNPYIINKATGAMLAPGGASGPNRLLGSLSGGAGPGAASGFNPLLANLPGAAGTPAAPNAPAAPSAAPTTTIAPKVLPGVNIAALPPAPPAPTGYQNNAAAADTLAANTRKQALITSSATDVAKSANDNALMTQLQTQLNSIDPNGRLVGPGSAAYKSALELQAAVTGKSPNSLNVMGITAKLAAQLGMQNAQTLLKGMRITQQELAYVTTVASANPNQPLAVMKAIVGLQKANTEYTGLQGQTVIRGIRSGADPDQISGGIEAQVPRSAYVANRVTEMIAPAPAKSLAALKQYPSKVDDFKARYGYLPTGNQ
jgi:hypothetical protein